jgi:hypothetical protein
MVAYLGNGTVANPVFAVCLGQVNTNSSGVVTSIIWYAMNGRYDSGWTATLPGAASNVTVLHYMYPAPAGSDFGTISAEILLTPAGTVQSGFSSGFVYKNPSAAINGNYFPISYFVNGMDFEYTTGNYYPFSLVNASGAVVELTAADWQYRHIVRRGW